MFLYLIKLLSKHNASNDQLHLLFFSTRIETEQNACKNSAQRIGYKSKKRIK